MKKILTNFIFTIAFINPINFSCNNNEIHYLKRKLEMLEEKVSRNNMTPKNLSLYVNENQRTLEWTFEKDGRTVTGRTALHNFEIYRDQYNGVLCSTQYKDKYINELNPVIIKELYIDENGTKDLAVFDGYHLDYFLKIQTSKEPSYLWIREF